MAWCCYSPNKLNIWWQIRKTPLGWERVNRETLYYRSLCCLSAVFTNFAVFPPCFMVLKCRLKALNRIFDNKCHFWYLLTTMRHLFMWQRLYSLPIFLIFPYSSGHHHGIVPLDCFPSPLNWSKIVNGLDCFPVPYGICNGVSGGIGEGTSLSMAQLPWQI